MRSIFLWATLGPSFLLSLPVVSFASFEDNMGLLKNRLLHEAPQAWKAYHRFAEKLQVHYVTRRKSFVDGRLSESQRFTGQVKQTGEAALRLTLFEEPDTKGEAEVTNPQYTIKLKRQTQARGWVLHELTLASPARGATPQAQEVRSAASEDLCTCIRLWNIGLPTLFRDPDFVIKSIVTIPSGTGMLWKIEFSYLKPRGQYPIPGAIPITNGWFLLDPDHDWVLREFDVYSITPDRTSIYSKFDMKEGTNRHPLMTQSLVRIKARTPKGIVESVIESNWNVAELEAIPLSDFTATAFGLPEPRGITWERRSRWYFWFFIAGLLTLALAGFLWRRVQRRNLMNELGPTPSGGRN